MNTGIPRNQNDGIYDTYGDAQGDKLSLREGHVIYVRSASLYAEVVTTVTPYPITGSNPALYIQPQNTTPGTGETNTGSNIGLGEGTFAQKSGTDLQFHSQVSQFGLESRLIDDTYYRGLNPFVADNIGSFIGNMEITRSTPTTVINRSGVIEDVPVDSPSYGKGGLSCYGSVTCNYPYSGALTTENGWSAGASSLSLDPSYDVGKITASKVTPSTQNTIHTGPIRSHIPSIGVNSVTYLIRADQLGIILFGSSSQWSPVAGFQLCKVDFRGGTVSFGSEYITRMERLSGGWWLFTHKFEVDSSTSGTPTFHICSNAGAQTWASNGTDSVYVGLVQESSTTINPPIVFTGATAETTSSDIVTFPVNGNMPVPGGDFCFVVDLNMFNSDGFGAAIQLTDSNVSLTKTDAGKNYASIKTSDGTFNAGLSDDVDDEVVRFTVKYEGKILKLFKNGVLVESKATTGTPLYTTSDLISVGSNHINTKSINTQIKIKKWLVNEVLTDAQILELGGPDNVIL